MGPFERNRVLTLRFLARGVPYSSHLLKLDLSNISFTLFQYNPTAVLVGYFDLISAEENNMEETPSISQFRMHTVSHDLPRLFLVVGFFFVLFPLSFGGKIS